MPQSPVSLDSIGVVQRLEKSRHEFFTPAVRGMPARAAFRFTLDRAPLVELARREETVAWPVNDGGVEYVTLHAPSERDGNVFITGEVADEGGQFILVMTGDSAVNGHLLSRRGMYSYGSQLDEIVGQRIESVVRYD